MGITLARPSYEDLTDLGMGIEGRPFTYDEVGATAMSSLPAGYRHDRRRVQIGCR
jgi:uncharacterized protein (UPF0548 family)